ncbi:nucleoside phosphorylase [Candidatus Saccharibacteria bacterium]|nr:nucleoside phosphorylase [Candidatus Saccharibacteria bacterium]
MIKYDPERKTVFSPFDLKLNGNPTKCLLIFDDEIWEDFVLPNEKLETISVTNAYGRTFDTYRYIEVDGEKILLVYPTMGAAGSVCDTELLIASGIKTFVAFGTCGRLDKNIAKNTIILPTAAYREEGTSYHYLPDTNEIDVDESALEIAEKVFNDNDFVIKKGKIWTTDAVYRETFNKVKLMQDRGCIGVEMELSALLALAKYRDIKFTEFLIADDTVDGEAKEPLARRNEDIFNAAMEILNSIAS